VTQAYEAHGGYSSAVVLTTAAPAFDLQFRLPPQGRVSGVVLDEAGEPVRNANVQLFLQQVIDPSASAAPPTFTPRGMAQTDDRGAYEFAGLPPASYQVFVQARPWYAAQAQQRPPLASRTTTSSTPATEPSLDVVYEPTWYPGVTDEAQAETIALGPGDEGHADFQMVPVQSLHLQIIAPTQSGGPNQRTMPTFPIVERMDTSALGRGFSQSTNSTNSQGMIDVGGLTPGTYRVTLQTQGATSKPVVVQLTPGASRVIDLREANSSLTTVSIDTDGGNEDEDGGRFVSAELVDTTTGKRYSSSGGGRFMPSVNRGGAPESMMVPNGPMRSGGDRSFQVPPGRYEVVTSSRGSLYVTGLTAQGADLNGRIMTVRSGDVKLTLHLATGRATVRGVAILAGKPCSGAAVLLVPAGLDDPHSFTAVARDQSNTDGSFDLEDVVPGQYILLAVDRGWNINWRDPSTIRQYLVHGVPVEIAHDQSLKQNIDAQAP
jgi:hypothetical protein